jgi:hypothetical protein
LAIGIDAFAAEIRNGGKTFLDDVEIERDVRAKQRLADNDDISGIVLNVKKVFVHHRVFAAKNRIGS